MSLQRRGLSSAAPGGSVRRYLSEADEKEALRMLKEKLRRQKRITSDDVRLAVRSVAGQDGAVPLPPDFPPSGWVIEFKRVHGFIHFNSFTFGAAASSSSSGKTAAAFGQPERLEVPPLCSLVAAADNRNSITVTATGRKNINGKSNISSSIVLAQVTGSSSDDEKDTSKGRCSSGSSDPAQGVIYPISISGPRMPFDSEMQRQIQLRHSFSQRHRQYLQQQQRRAILVGNYRRSAGSMPIRDSPMDHVEMRSSGTSGSENGTTGPSNSPRDDDDVGPVRSSDTSSMLPRIQYAVSNNGSSVEEMQDTASNASPSNDNRGYKLSHTVPAETWSKAIAAVEQQGMSLRAAAKLYGVHFAALHRRVKKRAQAMHAKGTDGYFHPSDEAGIMRVVVARAELGVLMTFDELMRLVEAAALRKLPDISMDSARKLLTRFQSRNEQSIRHIIDDWPPPRPAVSASSTSAEHKRPQHQPYLEHPGFNFGRKPPVALRSPSVGTSSRAASVAAMAAAKTTLFVPPSRLDPPPSSVGSRTDETRRSRMRLMNGKGSMTVDTGLLSGKPNDQMIYMSPRARSERDSDAVMVV
ncbi:hypothetical protein AM587_10015460 [Phytophthora nicotianae]|uniref:HTH psq-type domain-containing protein n=1 Tax=Phytophthora nicotianae TaxID=4792 RepID=A0A0W8BK54_PHYNI|nr:hypothetical protein AM587_10015460 [Phytophthora nicotianae]